MSSSRKRIPLLCAAMVAAGTIACAAEPGYYGYGERATPAQIAGWDIDARGEDGVGLPAGSGTSAAPGRSGTTGRS
jgi:cytochrome c